MDETEIARRLASQLIVTSSQVDRCFVRAVEVGGIVRTDGAAEHLKYGAGRRFGILRNDLEFIGRVSDPDRSQPLTSEESAPFDLHLNSLYLHVRGCLDNLAWCLVHELEVLGPVRDTEPAFRRRVGLFNPAFRRALGEDLADLRDRLTQLADWHTELSSIRDPVAHRIPLYAIPAARS